MTTESVSFHFQKIPSLDKLTLADQQLVSAAQESVERAYAVYSGFRVGATVRLANDKLISGSNQENAAYPSGLCAERVAVFSAMSQYPGTTIESIAVTVIPGHSKGCGPAAPCGGCRQVLFEYESLQRTPIRILLKGTQSEILIINSIQDILPFGFGPASLLDK